MRKILVLMMAGFFLVTCGSSSVSLCEQIGTAICQKACACLDGPMCAVSQGGLTVNFDTEADCRGLFVTLGCSSGDKAAYNDAAACLPLVQAATCTGAGTDAAVLFPPDMACQSPSP
jgi:hypothetical protein